MMQSRLCGHSPSQIDRLKREPPLLALPIQLRPDVGLQRIPLMLLIAERGADEQANDGEWAKLCGRGDHNAAHGIERG